MHSQNCPIHIIDTLGKPLAILIFIEHIIPKVLGTLGVKLHAEAFLIVSNKFMEMITC